jgi:GNAT superfamily N-acetyltransferase
MWVDPGSRRLGIGERLISELEGWARRWQAIETVLWVLAGNMEARSFYERIGFQVVEAGPDAESGARYEAIAMRRVIGRVD